MKETQKKLITSLVLLVCTVICFVLGSYTYFTDEVSTRGINFSSGNLSVELRESSPTLENGLSCVRIQPGMKVVSTASVENTGNLPAYVRVKLDKVITLSQASAGREAEIDPSLISLDINTALWQEKDGFYYCLSPVEVGGSSPALFTTVSFDHSMGNLYKESSFDLIFQLEAVQANNNGTDALSAEGWPTDNIGGNQ